MSRLQEEAKDLLAATEGHTPGPWEAHGPFDDEGPELWWDVFAQPGGSIAHVSQKTRGSKEHVKRTKHDATLLAAAPALRNLLAAMVAEVERLEEREPYHAAHVELLRQFEQTALQNLAEAKARMEMLERQVVALRRVESTWGHRSAGKNEVQV